jgi:hypothetical protein
MSGRIMRLWSCTPGAIAATKNGQRCNTIKSPNKQLQTGRAMLQHLNNGQQSKARQETSADEQPATSAAGANRDRRCAKRLA